MDKVVEFIKKNKVKVAGALIMIAAFVILLIINLHVDYTSDDFRYRFIYDTPGNPLPTTKKISSFWDVIISMINHWKLCNGRVVAHGLLQMVMPFGKLFFRIFNSLVYVSEKVKLIFTGTCIYWDVVFLAAIRLICDVGFRRGKLSLVRSYNAFIYAAV